MICSCNICTKMYSKFSFFQTEVQPQHLRKIVSENRKYNVSVTGLYIQLQPWYSQMDTFEYNKVLTKGCFIGCEAFKSLALQHTTIKLKFNS